MNECKHELPLLMGTARGIICRGCGKVFASLDEITPAEKPAEQPKKRRTRKAADNA